MKASKIRRIERLKVKTKEQIRDVQYRHRQRFKSYDTIVDKPTSLACMGVYYVVVSTHNDTYATDTGSYHY